MPDRSSRRLLSGVIAALIGCAALHAAGEVPEPPPSFVLDAARIFDATAVERMSRALAAARAGSGVSIYIATSSYLDPAAGRHRALELLEHWLPENPGLVLVFNRGDGQLGIVASPGLWRRHPPDEISRLLADAARVMMQAGIAPEHRIQEAVSLVVDRIRLLEASRPETADFFSGGQRRLGIATGAILAIMGLGCSTVWWIRRREKAASGGPYLFPEASVPFRLGARFGGGVAGTSDAGREG